MLFRAGLRAGISGAGASCSCCCMRLLAVRAISKYSALMVSFWVHRRTDGILRDCVEESLSWDFVEEEELSACSSAKISRQPTSLGPEPKKDAPSSFSSTMVEICGLLTKEDARVAGLEWYERCGLLRPTSAGALLGS